MTEETHRRSPLRKRLAALLGAIGVAAVITVTGGDKALADGEQVSGNKNCSQLIPGALEVRDQSASSKTLQGEGAFKVAYVVRTLLLDDPQHDGNQTGSQVFDFTATGGTVLGVAVKGGPNTNFYDYRPGGTTQQTGLHAPVNASEQNDRFYGLSHISFCYAPRPPEGNVRVVKKDDNDTAMNGVTFQLKDGNNQVVGSCTTANGECTISGVPLGQYTLDEAGGIPGTHSKDPTLPKQVNVTQDGQTVTVNVTNPRNHKVIVIVCHEGSNTLAATTVQNGQGSKTSTGTPPAGITEEQLCNLGGASWGGFKHSDNKTTTAQFGTALHP